MGVPLIVTVFPDHEAETPGGKPFTPVESPELATPVGPEVVKVIGVIADPTQVEGLEEAAPIVLFVITVIVEVTADAPENAKVQVPKVLLVIELIDKFCVTDADGIVIFTTPPETIVATGCAIPFSV